MRVRPVLTSVAAASLMVLGAGLTALPASAVSAATIAIDAPEAIGFGSDWSDVILTVAANDAIDATVGLNLHGDADLSEGMVLLQVEQNDTWHDVDLTETSGDLTGSLTQPGSMPAEASTTIDLRIAATGSGLDFLGLGDSLTTVSLIATLDQTAPPALRKRTAAGPPLGTAHADIDVAPLDITTTPSSATADIGSPLDISVTTTNHTGASYHDVGTIPLADGADDAGSSDLSRVASLLKNVKTSKAAHGATLIEFYKDGQWIDLDTIQDPNDFDFVDLANGASHTTKWRVTYNDSSLDPDSSILWLAVRFAPPSDDVSSGQQQLIDPDAGADIAGFAEMPVTIASDAAPSTPADDGNGDDDGNGGVTPAAVDELAATGSDLRRETGLGLLLIGLGGASLLATTRRRRTH